MLVVDASYRLLFTLHQRIYRFLLSLGSCETCLVMDDELNVLPISAGKDVKPISKIEACFLFLFFEALHLLTHTHTHTLSVITTGQATFSK